MVYSAYSLYKNACHYFALEVTRHPAMSPKIILNVMRYGTYFIFPVKGAVLNQEGRGTYGYFNKGAAKTIYIHHIKIKRCRLKFLSIINHE